MLAIGHDDHMLDALKLIPDLFDQGQEVEIEHQGFVFSVIDDVDQLIRKEARIERVDHAAHAGNAVPSLQVAVGVPSHGPHEIMLFQAEPFQRLSELFGAHLDFRPDFCGTWRRGR